MLAVQREQTPVMWSRCWWATWLSGFFGVFGLLHFVRLFVPFRVVIGNYEVPLKVTMIAGIISLTVSAGLLLLEVRRERVRKAAEQ